MPASRSSRPLAATVGVLAAAALVAGAAAPAHADPVALTVSLSAPVVTLPIGDGYRDDESLAITASDAATATVSLQRDGAAATVLDPALALAAGTTSITVPTAGLAAGTWTATVTTTDGATQAATFTVAALHAAVTKLAVSRSASSVFPVKDGYRDSVVFTVTPTVSGPSSAKVTGTAKLTRAGRTAKSWNLHGGRNRLTWNGKAGTRVKPGTYTLTVRAKGPQGGTRTARTSVVVSAKRLVSRTTTVTKDASKVFDRFRGYDGMANDCGRLAAFVLCKSATKQSDDPYTVLVGGLPGLPKAVRTGTAYGKPQLRVALRTTKLTGRATWGYGVGSAGTSKRLAKGTSAGAWIRWSGNPSTATIYVGLEDDSAIAIDRVTFTYRYRALV